MITGSILPKQLTAITGDDSKHTTALLGASHRYSWGASLRRQDFLDGDFILKDGFILSDNGVAILLPGLPVISVLLLKKRLVQPHWPDARIGDAG